MTGESLFRGVKNSGDTGTLHLKDLFIISQSAFFHFKRYDDSTKVSYNLFYRTVYKSFVTARMSIFGIYLSQKHSSVWKDNEKAQWKRR